MTPTSRTGADAMALVSMVALVMVMVPRATHVAEQHTAAWR
jgi:hypothetical protein